MFPYSIRNNIKIACDFSLHIAFISRLNLNLTDFIIKIAYIYIYIYIYIAALFNII